LPEGARLLTKVHFTVTLGKGFLCAGAAPGEIRAAQAGRIGFASEASDEADVTSKRPGTPPQRQFVGWTVAVLMMPLLFAGAMINEVGRLAKKIRRKADD
jgi:hypothetical protein